jgi:hypothetical protein
MGVFEPIELHPKKMWSVSNGRPFDALRLTNPGGSSFAGIRPRQAEKSSIWATPSVSIQALPKADG